MDFIKPQDEKSQAIYEKIYFIQSPIQISKIYVDVNQSENMIPKHWHRSVEIIVPRIQVTEVWREGRIERVYPDEFLIINSKDIHSCRSLHSDQPYFGYAIQIRYNFLKECFPDFDSYDFKNTFTKQESDTILSQLNKIIAAYFSKEQFKNIELYGVTYELIYHLLSHHIQKKLGGYSINTTKHKDLLVSVLEYLNQTSDEYFDALKIAHHFHISYGYLAKLFKDYLHMSMKEYVDSQRIRKAEKDLLTTDKPIIDIALERGFANSKAFYREFKKYHSKTPKEYRQKYLKK